MESKLPDDTYKMVFEILLKHKHADRTQAATEIISLLEKLNNSNGWKVKYDELQAEYINLGKRFNTAQATIADQAQQHQQLKERCDKMEKDITHFMDVFKMITKMPVPATENEYMSWFVYVKNMAGGVISEREAEKEVQQWKDGKEVARPCPHCGKELSRDRNLCCRECGKEVVNG